MASDFRFTHFKQQSRTLVVFAVDASGSSALHRLAEAKGAVELILGECYVRRDEVAVIGFRNRTAQLLLPPTRSLVRARHHLAGLPGGGGTPVAAGLASAHALALAARRRGDTPLLVLLTDGHANIDLSGAPGRDSARRDALRVARQIAEARVAALLIDTAPRPQPLAQALAAALEAQYIPLPVSNSAAIAECLRRPMRNNRAGK
jgi:magnesium chelatase subunit D